MMALNLHMNRDDTISEVTKRLVKNYDPERVYLFGSAARGETGRDSDLDFCVVVPDNAAETASRPVNRSVLRGLGTAVDVVFWTATDFDARAVHVAASLPATVVREGRLLYDARRVTT
jgi:predicted nucleotidyltransferase